MRREKQRSSKRGLVDRRRARYVVATAVVDDEVEEEEDDDGSGLLVGTLGHWVMRTRKTMNVLDRTSQHQQDE